MRTVLLALVGLVMFSGAPAQQLTFSNATHLPPLPLDNASIEVLANGDVQVQCAMQDDGACPWAEWAGDGEVPLVQLTRQGSGPVTTGQPVVLNWNLAHPADVCQASSSPAHPSWQGPFRGASSAAHVTFTQAGTYTLSLRCYNSYGVSTTAQQVITVNGGPVTPPPVGTIPTCATSGLSGHPLVQPAGYTGHIVSWQNAFFGAQFPRTSAHLAPVGAFTLRSQSPSTQGPPMNARYIAIPFVAGINQPYRLHVYGAQPIRDADYGNGRVARSVFMSVSVCAGDLRPYNRLSPDVQLSKCRFSFSEGTFGFGTSGGAAACPLVAGVTYYLNVAFVDTSNGTAPTGTTTCARATDQDRCEVNIGS